MSQLVLFFAFIGEFLTTSKVLLFYDQVEYLRIVSTHSFWQVFPLGHFPIHPIFLAIFWITSRLIEPNATALLFGIISGILMYKISKVVFKDKKYWLACFIFLIFPGVWLINTNLMTESMLLAFYLVSIYAFLKRKSLLFFLAVFAMLGVHIDAIYWIPTIFLLPFIFKKEVNFKRSELLKFIKLGTIATLVSIAFYAFIYIVIRKDFNGSGEQLLAYGSFGFLRMLRNTWYSFINNFGSLTLFVIVFLLIKYLKSRSQWIAWIIFGLTIFAGGSFWAGDLMMRRIVFAGVILSLALFKYLKGKTILVISYSIPIMIANAALYYQNTETTPLSLMQKNIDQLPKGQVLIQSNYYAPFTKYDGKILWMGRDDFSQLDDDLNNGYRVFLTGESVTAPYLLVVGNNYHITSFDRIGESDAKGFFKKYKVDLFGGNFELKEPIEKKVSPMAGEPVVFYNEGFWGRLSRHRINYGDIGVWLWAIATNHRDSTGWTYKDVNGAWVYPGIKVK